jgi:hypothetical protein
VWPVDVVTLDVIDHESFQRRVAIGIEHPGAVMSGFGGRQMPLQDAGYRQTSLDVVGEGEVKSPTETADTRSW